MGREFVIRVTPTMRRQSVAFIDKLREEIITSQQTEGNLTRWKLLLIAAIGASGLGFLNDSPFTERTMALLALLPLVCLYVDALCFHSGRRVMTIAKYLRNVDPNLSPDGMRSEMEEARRYELFCRKNRSEFGLEGIALLSVSLLLSMGVAIAGLGLLNRARWMPTFPPGDGQGAWGQLLPLLLIGSGGVGVITCGALYGTHRKKVRELDLDPPILSFAIATTSSPAQEAIQSRKIYEVSGYHGSGNERQIEIRNDRNEKCKYPLAHFVVIAVDDTRIQ